MALEVTSEVVVKLVWKLLFERLPDVVATMVSLRVWW